jgi:SAM-dependent methyltransferase
VHFVTGDVSSLRLGASFPLIISNCSLHWMHPFAEGMSGLLRLADAGGFFAASIMLRGTLGELHASRLAAAPGKPPLAQMPDEADVVEALRRGGFAIPAREVAVTEAASASPEALLRMLHQQGLTGGALSRSHAPLARRELALLAGRYKEQFGLADGTVRVTYRVGYFLARRAA